MANNTIASAKQINSSNKAQSSQALLIQQYANSVLEQPNVNFSGIPKLETFQTQINTGLGKAQAHATTYLKTIQPSVITNITNISNYFALHNAVATTLPPGSAVKQWTDALSALKEQAQTDEGDAKGVVTALSGLHGDLTTDSAAFAKTVSELNAAVNGDDGVLKPIDGEFSSIQSKIDGAIAGTVLSRWPSLAEPFWLQSVPSRIV